MSHGKVQIFLPVFLGLVCCLAGLPAAAQNFKVQCPETTTLHPLPGGLAADGSRIKCVHLSGGDGYATMADSSGPTYIFGFSNLTNTDSDPARRAIAAQDPAWFNTHVFSTGSDITANGAVGAKIPAPLIVIDEGDELFLTLSNVAMSQRPDLFDGHSVHFPRLPERVELLRWPSGRLDRGHSWRQHHVLLRCSRSGHVHLSLSRGSGRAHADGHARAVVRETAAEQNRRRCRSPSG